MDGSGDYGTKCTMGGSCVSSEGTVGGSGQTNRRDSLQAIKLLLVATEIVLALRYR